MAELDVELVALASLLADKDVACDEEVPASVLVLKELGCRAVLLWTPTVLV